METLECIKRRCSTRKFLSKAVEKEKLDILANAAINAPSGMNRQSWHFSIVTNEDWLKRIDERIYSIVNENNIKVNMDRNGMKGYSCHYHSPVLIIVSADPNSTLTESDCACALENIFLAAEDLGLGSCWINQLGKVNCEKVRDLISEAGVPKDYMVFGCAAIGYKESSPIKPERKQNVISYYN